MESKSYQGACTRIRLPTSSSTLWHSLGLKMIVKVVATSLIPIRKLFSQYDFWKGNNMSQAIIFATVKQHKMKSNTSFATEYKDNN